ATSTLLARRTTSSSTKMGAPTRSASAMASEGRESTVISSSPSRRWIRAKNVLSRRSLTTIFSTLASTDSRMFLIRSWVMGRGDLLELEGNGVGFEDADPDGEGALLLLVAQDDDRHVRHRVEGEPAHLHLNPHRPLLGRMTRAARRSPLALGRDARLHGEFWHRIRAVRRDTLTLSSSPSLCQSDRPRRGGPPPARRADSRGKPTRAAADQVRAALRGARSRPRLPLPFQTSGGFSSNRLSSRPRRSFQPSWYSSSSSWSVAGCLMPWAERNCTASSPAFWRTPSHGVPSAN